MKDGGPAFPVDLGYNMGTGMTKLEWYAGMALAGPLPPGVVGFSGNGFTGVAEYCFDLAAAMLAEAKKREVREDDLA